MEKVRIANVKVEWSESNRLEDGTMFPTLADANVGLRFAAQAAPAGGGYHKTSVVITWADGETYQARIDLVREDAQKANLIGAHVREFCEFASGRKCPPGWTPERLEQHLAATERHCPGAKEGFAKVLDGYELEERAPEPLAPEPPPKPECRAQYNNEKGAKYDPDLDIAEIAKKVRADIKAAKLPGKISVRIQRYAGGRSLRVKAVVPFPVRHGDVERENRERAEGLDCPWLTREAYELQEKLKEITEAYNYDRSDIQTDYFDVNFYLHVDLEQAKCEAKEAA